MKINNIQYPVFNPYNKATLEIYVSGCYRNCKGCHNDELKNFNIGKEIEYSEFIPYLLERTFLFECISVTGGDLLCQKEGEAKELSLKIREAFPMKEMWLFTGEDEFRKMPIWTREIYDIIKYGSYKKELKQKGFPASSNQQIWRKNEDTSM